MATLAERVDALEQKLARLLDSNANLRHDRIATPGALEGGKHVVWGVPVGLVSAPDEPQP